MVLSASSIESHPTRTVLQRVPAAGVLRGRRHPAHARRVADAAAVLEALGVAGRHDRRRAACWCSSLIFGYGYGGNRNWLEIGSVSVQPSEFVKIALVVWIAWVLSTKQHLLGDWKHVALPIAPVALVAIGLVLIGNDLGTAIDHGRARARLPVLRGGQAALPRPHDRWRSACLARCSRSRARPGRSASMVWLHGCTENDDCGLVLAGAARLVGARGRRRVRRRAGQLDRRSGTGCPRPPTTSSSRSSARSSGSSARSSCSCCSSCSRSRSCGSSARRATPFARIVTGGVMIWIVGQAFVNIAVVLGVLPVLGVPLPLISAGGSALIATLLAIGVVLSFARDPTPPLQRSTRRVPPAGRVICVTTYLMAGGGTAGHVNPLLAVADRLRERDPAAEILVLGTEEGLEARLVPERGYELLTIPRLPFPRRPNRAALCVPEAVPARRSTARREYLRDREVDVVVGFGGYASAPAYVGRAPRGRARSRSTRPTRSPASPTGSARGTRSTSAWRSAARACAARPGRRACRCAVEIERLDRFAARRRGAGATSGSTRPSPPCSSPAARPARIGSTARSPTSIATILGTGWQVLHITGANSRRRRPAAARLSRLPVLRSHGSRPRRRRPRGLRAGAATVARVRGARHPCRVRAVRGRQRRAALQRARRGRAGGAILVDDAGFTPAWVADELVPLLPSRARDRRHGRAHGRVVGALDGSRPDGRTSSSARAAELSASQRA